MSDAHRGLQTGENNPFYGRKHTEESKAKIGAKSVNRYFSLEARKKMSEKRKGKPCSKEAIEKMKRTKGTPEFKIKLAAKMTGVGNPFYGRKHTKETKKKIALSRIGRKMSEEACRKMSENRRGERNHMYGKPPLKNTSTGIGGWFNGIYFRSSCELNFLLNHQDVDWQSSEQTAFRIPYVNSRGEKRNYFPDFFGDGFLVEVKPKNWQNDPTKHHDVEAKSRAAVRFCQIKGFSYIRVEMPVIDKKKIFKIRETETIKLNSRWEKSYQKWKTSQNVKMMSP
ncbi:MAG: hypothetical protein KGL39_00185 [Patescibacteria group bacterium]|nr:hypothetical protein [Patescibacteria group bacterium]